MKEFENIVSSEESAKTIDKAPIEPPVKQAPIVKSFKGVKMADTEPLTHVDEDIYHGVKASDYENEYNKGAVIVGPGGLEALQNDRADQQGFGRQILNMVGQAVAGEVVGGTVQGLGYLLEIPKAIQYVNGTEQEFGNFLTDVGEGIRKESQDFMPIYQRTDSDWHDSGWWAQNGVSVASSLSMMLPSMAATKALGMLGKGVSRGMGMLHNSLDIAAKLGKYGTWAAEGITQAVVSRHIENAMEASGVFKEQKEKLQNQMNPKTRQLFTEEEATKLAAEGASSTYSANWAMLAQDIPQYLALGKIFNPKTMQMEKAGMGMIGQGAKTGIKERIAAGLGTFASEGAEESYQYYMAERGKLLSDLKAGLIDEHEYNKKLGEKVGDKEMMTSAFWGGLGGNVFSAVGGATNNLFKSKERRDYEDRYAELNANHIKERGKAFAMMQQEVMKADESGDPVKRAAAINESTMGMALEALSNDSLDQHIEMLNNMQNMSKEEAQAFAAQTGDDINIDLIKQSAPNAIKQAQELRTSYLKNLNKYDSDTAIAMSRNDYHIKEASKRDKQLQGEMQETRAAIPEIGDASGHLRDVIKNKANILALKKVNEIHAKAIENTSSPTEIKEREKLIKANESKIARMVQAVEHLDANDRRDADQKDIDERVKAGFNNAADDLVPAQTERALLKDFIFLRQQENTYLKTEAYQKEIKNKKIDNKIKSIVNNEGIETARRNIESNEEMSQKEKDDLYKKLDKRTAEIAEENKIAEAKRKAAELEVKLNAEQKNKANATKTTVPKINMSSIGNNLEDEYSGEEPDINGDLTSKSDKLRDDIIENNFDNAKIYTDIGSPEYQAWVMNGKPKKGTAVKVTISRDKYVSKSFQNEKLKALELLEKAMKGEILEANDLNLIYHYAPIKVNIGGSDTNYSFISAFSNAPIDPTSLENWKKAWARDFATRKAFIDIMIANKKESVDTKVKLQYGGEVQQSTDPSGKIPENKITDFKHLKLKASEKHKIDGSAITTEQIIEAIGNDLMFTDENGFMFDMNKEMHPNHIGAQMILPGIPGTDGATVPLRGAIFLSTTKADGFPFPLKLNIAKHTQEEAEVIADLIGDMVADGSKISMKSKLKELNPAIQQRLKDTHKAAMDHLTKVKANPTVEEILNAFVYIDPKTKGKTSEMRFSKDNKQLFFGIEGKVLNSRNLAAKTDLVKFLVNNKRKQFDIEQWKDNRLYKKYALESGLINTDAEVHGDLFGGRTDVYIEVPGAKAKSKPIQKATTPKGQLSIVDRVAISKKEGTKNAKENGKDGFSGVYVDPTGKHIKIFREGKSSKPVQDEINRLFDEDIKNAKLSKGVNNSRQNPVVAAEDKITSEKSKLQLGLINGDKFKGKETELINKFNNELDSVRKALGLEPMTLNERTSFIKMKYNLQNEQTSFEKLTTEMTEFTRNEELQTERAVAYAKDKLGDKFPESLENSFIDLKEEWASQENVFGEMIGRTTFVKTVQPTQVVEKKGVKKEITPTVQPTTHIGNILSMKSITAEDIKETPKIETKEIISEINKGEEIVRKVLSKGTKYAALSIADKDLYHAVPKTTVDKIREEVRQVSISKHPGNILSMGVTQADVNEFGVKVREEESLQEAIIENIVSEISKNPSIDVNLKNVIETKDAKANVINPSTMTDNGTISKVVEIFHDESTASSNKTTFTSLEDIVNNTQEKKDKKCDTDWDLGF